MAGALAMFSKKKVKKFADGGEATAETENTPSQDVTDEQNKKIAELNEQAAQRAAAQHQAAQGPGDALGQASAGALPAQPGPQAPAPQGGLAPHPAEADQPAANPAAAEVPGSGAAPQMAPTPQPGAPGAPSPVSGAPGGTPGPAGPSLEQQRLELLKKQQQRAMEEARKIREGGPKGLGGFFADPQVAMSMALLDRRNTIGQAYDVGSRAQQAIDAREDRARKLEDTSADLEDKVLQGQISERDKKEVEELMPQATNPNGSLNEEKLAKIAMKNPAAAAIIKDQFTRRETARKEQETKDEKLKQEGFKKEADGLFGPDGYTLDTAKLAAASPEARRIAISEKAAREEALGRTPEYTPEQRAAYKDGVPKDLHGRVDAALNLMQSPNKEERRRGDEMLKRIDAETSRRKVEAEKAQVRSETARLERDRKDEVLRTKQLEDIEKSSAGVQGVYTSHKKTLDNIVNLTKKVSGIEGNIKSNIPWTAAKDAKQQLEALENALIPTLARTPGAISNIEHQALKDSIARMTKGGITQEQAIENAKYIRDTLERAMRRNEAMKEHIQNGGTKLNFKVPKGLEELPTPAETPDNPEPDKKKQNAHQAGAAAEMERRRKAAEGKKSGGSITRDPAQMRLALLGGR